MKVLEKTITSIEVAEMVGRRHDQVLRDIQKIIEHLTDHKSVASKLFNYQNTPKYRADEKSDYAGKQ